MTLRQIRAWSYIISIYRTEEKQFSQAQPNTEKSHRLQTKARQKTWCCPHTRSPREVHNQLSHHSGNNQNNGCLGKFGDCTRRDGRNQKYGKVLNYEVQCFSFSFPLDTTQNHLGRYCLHQVEPWACLQGIILIKIIYTGSPSPLWAALFSRQGLLNYIRVEKQSTVEHTRAYPSVLLTVGGM